MKLATSDECDVLLRDGGIAHIRRLRPSDREALHELVDRTSEHSAYLRFFTGGRATAHTYMDRLTRPEGEGHALVAFMQGRLVAVAEYMPSGDRADLGILLDDGVHGHGLGTLLLEHLAVDAAEDGVRELVADVLSENRPMLRVLQDIGLECERRFDGGQVQIRIVPSPTPELLAGIEARAHQAEHASLTRLLAPKSVAVIGASRDPAGVGHRILRNLVDGGFPGPVFPVNPSAEELCGLPVFHDISAVPGPVDLAVVATPAHTVLDVARACATYGVHSLVVVSAGFAEAGEGAGETRLLRICRDAGMRLVGPNCLGIVNTAASLNASFLPGNPPPGRLGLMSQSGAVAVALIDRAAELGLGISSFVSVGNKADVSGNDLLEYWEDDDATDVIALYLESFGNPRRFGRIARRVSARKPIIVVKSGRSVSGDRAVRSHTAAAATPDAAVEALLSASGVIRVDSVQDLLDTARLLTGGPLPRGPRVAIVGNSGGPQALCADACEEAGLPVPELGETTQRLLRSRLRPGAAVSNPVDLTADASAEELDFAVRTVLADPEVDSVLVIYTPPFGSGRATTEGTIARVAQDADKTVIACVIGHDGLIDEGVPSYAFPEQAVRALRRVVDYVRRRDELDDVPPPAVDPAGAVQAKQIIRDELGRHPEGRWLDYETASRLLACYGVHVAESVEAGGPASAVEAAARTGLPAVLKATGPDLVHKSDVGGVQVNLRTSQEVGEAYRQMAERIGPAMTGAIVQRMAESGVEIIIGGVQHAAFGPLIMAGMGGVTAELLADHSFRVPPISERDAARMLRELRCFPLLNGYRGRPLADIAALQRQIIGVAQLMEDQPEVAELDLNPVMVTPHGAVAVDVRVRLAPSVPPPSAFRRRLR